MIWSDIWQDIFFQSHLSEKQEINQLWRGFFAGRWFCRGSLITESFPITGGAAGRKQVAPKTWRILTSIDAISMTTSLLSLQ